MQGINSYSFSVINYYKSHFPFHIFFWNNYNIKHENNILYTNVQENVNLKWINSIVFQVAFIIRSRIYEGKKLHPFLTPSPRNPFYQHAGHALSLRVFANHLTTGKIIVLILDSIVFLNTQVPYYFDRTFSLHVGLRNLLNDCYIKIYVSPQNLLANTSRHLHFYASKIIIWITSSFETLNIINSVEIRHLNFSC